MKATCLALIVLLAVVALMVIGCGSDGNLPYQGDYQPGQGGGGTGGGGTDGGGTGGGTTPPSPPGGGGGGALQPPAPPLI